MLAALGGPWGPENNAKRRGANTANFGVVFRAGDLDGGRGVVWHAFKLFKLGRAAPFVSSWATTRNLRITAARTPETDELLFHLLTSWRHVCKCLGVISFALMFWRPQWNSPPEADRNRNFGTTAVMRDFRTPSLQARAHPACTLPHKGHGGQNTTGRTTSWQLKHPGQCYWLAGACQTPSNARCMYDIVYSCRTQINYGKHWRNTNPDAGKCISVCALELPRPMNSNGWANAERAAV